MAGDKCICLLALIIGASILPAISDATSFDFPKQRTDISNEAKSYLDGIPSAKWLEFVNSGVDSLNRQKRLEENLLKSDITVQNGTISHVQLLDTLPNGASKEDSEIALKILKSSLYVYNSQCLSHGIDGDECRNYLEEKPLPVGSSLREECLSLLSGNREGHHAFRRLLEPHYRNGFHEMFPETGSSVSSLPAAWSISKALYEPETIQKAKQLISEEKSHLNLGLAQWAQFVEHDLSKPVSQSMSTGAPIECCSRDQNNLQPRHHHPACAPILYQPSGKYDVPSCLNYVRSALAVADCNFGGAEQLNQATASLDLSQLYGFTSAAEQKMRLLRGGLLKSTSSGQRRHVLLPMTTDTQDQGHSFCAWGDTGNATCFAAGDSRVNSSPFSILIYTIFMRNHNRLARELSDRKPGWSDDQLFQAAKAVNVDIYRRVVIDEWLPEVLGEKLAAEARSRNSRAQEISNEFGVAAIRFYFSMLPNELRNLVKDNDLDDNNLPTTNLFELKEEIYKPRLQYTTQKLNEILESLLNQRTMKMDAAYAGDVVWHKDTKPTHADILAFDIQRGRDHGLQPYYKYFETCSLRRPVTGWKDFEGFIPNDVLDKLKTIYSSWTDIDLIVGGISERPVSGAIGRTFSCILGEQFWNVHQHHREQSDHKHDSLLNEYRFFNGSKLLCLNSDVRAVPQNIFQLPSASNKLVACDDVV